jgi:hypothetical protein
MMFETSLPSYDESTVLTRWLFLRGLGVLTALSFLSYLLQYRGLVGSNGLTPWVQFSEAVRSAGGWTTYLRVPSLALWFPGDTALFVMGIVGIVSALMLTVNWLPRLNLFLCWGLYLSLTVTGQRFMAYQWNQLLLEILFASILLASSTLVPRRVSLPSWIGVWYVRFLAFKLYFLSGLAKWGGGESWRNLTAMTHHYETQPIPNPVSWFAHHLPAWVHRFETLGTLVIEMVVPLFVFSPRRIRIPAAYLMGGLQLTIMATGNYGPFNWLALLLCLMLLDDQHLRSLTEWIPDVLRPRAVERPTAWTWQWDAGVVVVLLLLNVLVVGSWLQLPTPGWFNRSASYVQSFRTVNPYGLFGAMTKKRPEIVIQGSRDGETWRTYEFQYKPGDLDRAPGFAIWSLPRLDWRMWFAALRAPQRPRWMNRLFKKLLEGSPAVLDQFAENPFPDRPPRYLRALVYRYRFSRWEEGWETGRWWRRDQRRVYLPPVRLRGNRLVRARLSP